MTGRAMTVEAAAAKWLEGRRARQELAPATVASYRQHLASFTAYVGAGRPVAELDDDDFEGWLGQLSKRSGEALKPAALNTRASTVRAWAGWCARRRLAPYDFTASTGRAKVPHRPPKRIDAGSVRALLEVADSRERAILHLAFTLGLRRAEICGLRLDAWDRGRNEVEVLGKGNRVRVLPVEGAVLDALDEWAAIHALALPLRDLALVAVRDTGLGCHLIPRAEVNGWAPEAGTLTVEFRGRPRRVTLEGADRELVGLYVASLPGRGRQPGPLFPSAYHGRPGEALCKGTVARQVALTRRALAAERPERSPWLFPSDRRDAPLSLSRMSRLFAELGERAGLAKRLHPHVGRHTMASELVEAGADIGVVRDLLGHTSLATTSVYVSASAGRMRQAVAGLDYGEVLAG